MSEKQHYISRFYLNYFSPIKNPGMVWVYTNKRPVLRSIKKHVANIENFYTIDTTLGESNIIEKELGRIETEAGRVVKKLNENDFKLSPGELSTLIIFMSYLRARGPAFRDSVNKPIDMERKLMLRMIAQNEDLFNKEMGEILNDLGEKDQFTFSEYQKYISQNIDKMDLKMSRNESAKAMVIGAEELQRMFNFIKWNFLIAPNNFYYLTSDRPVLPFMNNWKMSYQPGFGLKDVEVYFPITPRICMMGSYTDLSVSAVVSGDMVNVINSRVIANSHKYIYSNMNESQFWAQSNITLNKIKDKKFGGDYA